MDTPLLRRLQQSWWIFLIRGIVAIVFGLAAIFMPGLTVVALLIAFGAFTLVDGVFAITAGLRHRTEDDQWWIWLIDGALSIVIGAMALLFPVQVAVAFTLLIAVWAVFAGIIRVMAAIRLRHQITGEWMFGLSGVLLIVWGVMMALLPAAGVTSLAWLIGFFSLLIGIMLCVLALRLRKLN